MFEHIKLAILCSWYRASRFDVNKCPTRWNYTRFSLSVNCCTCFVWCLHPSSGTQITVSTTSGTGQPLLLPVGIETGCSNGWLVLVSFTRFLLVFLLVLVLFLLFLLSPVLHSFTLWWHGKVHFLFRQTRAPMGVLWVEVSSKDELAREVWRERKNKKDLIIRCLLSTTVSTCFGHHYAHLQENKDRVTAFDVLFWFCWMWLVAVVGRCVVGCEQCLDVVGSGCGALRCRMRAVLFEDFLSCHKQQASRSGWLCWIFSQYHKCQKLLVSLKLATGSRKGSMWLTCVEDERLKKLHATH